MISLVGVLKGTYFVEATEASTTSLNINLQTGFKSYCTCVATYSGPSKNGSSDFNVIRKHMYT